MLQNKNQMVELPTTRHTNNVDNKIQDLHADELTVTTPITKTTTQIVEMLVNKIQKKPSILNLIVDNETEITLVERFDKQELYNHIYSGNLTLEYAKQLREYIKSAGYNNSIQVTYHIPTIGRMTTSVKEQYICTQIYQWNITKYYSCKTLYDDVDISNAHPVLFEQLLIHNKISCNQLTFYNNNRDKYLNEIIKSNKIDRYEAKGILLKIMNGTKQTVMNVLNKYKLPKQVIRMAHEILKARKQILAKYPQFIEQAKINKKKDGYNIEGTATALLCQTLERIVILSVYSYLKRFGKVGAIIHDGLHYQKGRITPTMIRLCIKHVLKETGFKIDLVVKPFSLREDQETPLIFDDMKDVPFTELNHKYLTKLNRYDNSGFELSNLIKRNNVYLIKSYTGSGKTKFLKAVTIKFPTYKVLSLVSRKSLAEQHVQDFDLLLYLKVKHHGLDEVYQLDSVDKVPLDKLNQDFILIMDEVASLCSHFLNHMSKMKRLRILLVQIFSQIMNHPRCKIICGVDANMNQGTYQFIKSLTSKPITIFYNKYVETRQTPINHYIHKKNLLQRVIDLLKEGENVFLCSNVNTNFKREIVKAVITELKFTKDKYLIYSGDEGQQSISTCDWINKRLICATPTILYGLDVTINLHVCGFYYSGDHMSALDLNQQLNRERMPKSINLYICDRYVQPFDSIESAKASCKLEYNVSYTSDTKSLDKYINATRNLQFYEDYKNSYYNNMTQFTLQLLRSKGYTNIHHIVENQCNIKYMSVQKYYRKLLNDYINYNDHAVNIPIDKRIDDKKLDDINEKLEVFKLEYDYELIMNEEDTTQKTKSLKVYRDIMRDSLDYFINNNKFKQLLHYKMYLLSKALTVQDNTIKITDFDIPESVIQDIKFKFSVLKLLKDRLQLTEFQEIESITRKNYNQQINLNKNDTNLIKQTFRIRSKDSLGTTRIELTQLYLNKLKSMFACCFRDSKKKVFTIDNKKKIEYKYPCWDKDEITNLNKIINFQKLKKVSKYQEYGFDDI